MTENPETEEEWQSLFDGYFPEKSGVLVTAEQVPGTPVASDPQMVGWNVFVEAMEGDTPRVVIVDVFNDFQLRLHVESVEPRHEGAVLAIRTDEGKTFTLSNRLLEDQREFIAARKDHGW